MKLKALKRLITEPIALCDKDGLEILKGYIEDLPSLNLFGMPSGEELLDSTLTAIEWDSECIELWLDLKLPRVRYCGDRKDLELGKSYAILEPDALYHVGYANVIQNRYGQYNILLLPGEWIPA